MPPTSPRGPQSTRARSDLDPWQRPSLQAGPCSLTQACRNGHTPRRRLGAGRAVGGNGVQGKAGPGQPSSPHAGLVRGLGEGAGQGGVGSGEPPAPSCWSESAAVAAVWLGRRVSGTEVYFQELTVGSRPPSPTLCPPCARSQGLGMGGQEVETSLSHSPFMLFLP